MGPYRSAASASHEDRFLSEVRAGRGHHGLCADAAGADLAGCAVHPAPTGAKDALPDDLDKTSDILRHVSHGEILPLSHPGATGTRTPMGCSH